MEKISFQSNPDPTFEVMLSMAIDGDEKAFKAIYDMFQGKMYSLCLRYAGNTADAEDLFQEGIIRVYRNLANFRAKDLLRMGQKNICKHLSRPSEKQAKTDLQ